MLHHPILFGEFGSNPYFVIQGDSRLGFCLAARPAPARSTTRTGGRRGAWLRPAAIQESGWGESAGLVVGVVSGGAAGAGEVHN